MHKSGRCSHRPMSGKTKLAFSTPNFGTRMLHHRDSAYIHLRAWAIFVSHLYFYSTRVHLTLSCNFCLHSCIPPEFSLTHFFMTSCLMISDGLITSILYQYMGIDTWRNEWKCHCSTNLKTKLVGNIIVCSSWSCDDYKTCNNCQWLLYIQLPV